MQRGKIFLRGFSIIEVVLVLGITGALFVVIIVGSGNTIQRHRYEESVQESVDIFQRIYNSVANPQINAPEENRCDGSATGGAAGPGRTSCVVYGKMIEFLDQNSIPGNPNAVIRVTTVVGDDMTVSKPGQAGADGNLSRANDKEALQSARLRLPVYAGTDRVIEGSEEVLQLAWTASFRRAKIDASEKLPSPPIADNSNYQKRPQASILIVRAPVSNTILTFIVDKNVSPSGSSHTRSPYCDFIEFKNEPSCQADYDRAIANQLFICVSPSANGDNNTALGTPNNMRALRFQANGSNPSAIELLPMDVSNESQPDAIISREVCH